MAVKQNDAALGKIPIAYPSIAGHAVTQRFSYALAGTEALNDIIEMAPIPVGCRVVDIVLDSDDVDDGTTITMSVGIMSGTWGDPTGTRTCGAEFFSASNVGQAGGVARPTLASAYRVAAAGTERSIGIKIAAAATTGKTGEVGLTVTYAA